MSKHFCPDGFSKKARYRVSLSKARAKSSFGKKETYILYYYSNIKERRKSRLFENYKTKRPYALNIQFKIRFFGMLHHIVSHGPEKAAKRWKQANLRWEKVARNRNISSRARERFRSYM
jgi:hypothetical protein